ncbi:MAG: DUF2270 domain-containing protein [DPANN group archaeon]|nr:DUF2270 domain-containing protein [DPANN group archaeon]
MSEYKHYNIEEDSAGRLLGNLYSGYVQNRNEEMTRIDNSTGWSVAIVTLILSFSLGINTPYYFVPLAIIFIAPFWLKESRRYVYYIFWSDKERKAEECILQTYKTGKVDSKKIIELIDDIRPLKIITLKKAMIVRLYRSYFWMIVMIFSVTFLLSYVQGAIQTQYIAILFLLIGFILLIAAVKGKDEFLLPRKIIMKPGIAN